MIIVGELINTSRKEVLAAVKERDVQFIQDLAKKQVEAGAFYVDVNAGMLLDEEPEAMKWLVETVQDVVDSPCCIDSPNPEALKVGLEVHKGKALINSISLEKERFDKVLPLIKEYKASVIALCMSDAGMPKGIEDRVANAKELVERLNAAGIPNEDIYIDPLIQPVSTSSDSGLAASESIKQIMENHAGVHTTCGLSNVSYGLPKRRLLNRAFLVQCMAAGMDSAILDPLDKDIMSIMYASEVLLNRDEYCLNYINAERENRLKA